MTDLDWGCEFEEAYDIDELGAASVRKLYASVAKGRPAGAQALVDRLIVDEMIGNFIERSCERDFAFVAVSGLV